jgi:hypothetical protein
MTVISRRQTARRLAQCLVAAVISVAALESAFAADEPATSRQCAARDLQILTIMEERGDADVVSREQLRAETFVLQEARNLCALHLIPEALAVYDRVLFDSKLIAAAPIN